MATFNALVNNRAVFDVPFQAVLNTFLSMIQTSGIPGVVTRANAFTIQRTSADVGVFSTSTSLTQSDFDAHKSNFSFGSVSVDRKNYITELTLGGDVSDNLMDYRSAAGGYDLAALKALADFVGVKFSSAYLNDVMSRLQALTVAQLTDYPAHYTTNMAGKIEWMLTDQSAPAGKTKILDLINVFYALFPPEMQMGGALGNYIVGYVSQADFRTMTLALNNAYQFNPTGGFSMGKDVFSATAGQLTLADAEVRIHNHNFAEVILGNIKFRPLQNLQNDTLLLTYQKIEGNKTLYYEKVDQENKQNLYFGMSGDFAYQKDMVESIYNLINEPAMLPVTVGRLIQAIPVPTGFMQENIIMQMGAGVVIQDPSRLFALFPNA